MKKVNNIIKSTTDQNIKPDATLKDIYKNINNKSSKGSINNNSNTKTTPNIIGINKSSTTSIGNNRNTKILPKRL